MRRIQKGLDLPITGAPEQQVSDGPPIRSVALIGPDYVGLKPTMHVAVGDRVRIGDLLFTDKKIAGVRHTSPACGTVSAINRGDKRAFQSMVIDVDGDEAIDFQSHSTPADLSREVIQEQLLASGVWTALRTRPYSKVADPTRSPSSIFVQAIDTNPLAPNPAVIIDQQNDLFRYGLQALCKLTDGPIYLCKPAGTVMTGGDVDGVRSEVFEGPHPAGLPGTHIHFLDPVSATKTVWHINYQDVIAVGHLLVEGRIMTRRIISIAGPSVSRPRLIRTQLGAGIDELTSGELTESTNRVISGSVLSGRAASGPFAWLGRYHLQISALSEGGRREFLGWQKPGFDKFSITRAFASAVSPRRSFAFDTSAQGSPRAMVPIGMYEKVMPLDILPTFLLRSLIVGDTDRAQALGCLELDEEDLALCTFVCPGKTDYGPLLRQRLTEIEKEG